MIYHAADIQICKCLEKRFLELHIRSQHFYEHYLKLSLKGVFKHLWILKGKCSCNLRGIKSLKSGLTERTTYR